jgi:hypothetical protein
MEALFVLFVIVRLLTNAAEDLHNAAKGRPRRPRLTDRINNWNGSGSGRYGARRYLADLWQDAWNDARAKRDAKRAKQAADAQPSPNPDPAPAPTPAPEPGEQPKPKPSPRPRPAPTPPTPPTPPASGEQPKLRLVPDPAAPTPDPATPPAGDTPQTPAQPAGKEDPMSTTASGEITSVAAARSFADAMLVHNKEVMAEIERAQNSLSSRGISGPVIAELNSLREYYAQAGGRWEGLLKAIAQHERLAEQVRATQGAAKDTSFYTNA